VISVGHRTYLETKVKGESSMFGKAKRREPSHDEFAEARMVW